jgi:hypothetical protein
MLSHIVEQISDVSNGLLLVVYNTSKAYQGGHGITEFKLIYKYINIQVILSSHNVLGLVKFIRWFL